MDLLREKVAFQLKLLPKFQLKLSPKGSYVMAKTISKAREIILIYNRSNPGKSDSTRIYSTALRLLAPQGEISTTNDRTAGSSCCWTLELLAQLYL